MAELKKSENRNLKILVLLFFTGLVIFVFLPQLDSFKTSLQSLKDANPELIALATVVFSMTYLVATLTFCLISFFKLSYKRTLLIQVADGFTNKLVPAGIGAVTTNFLYLKKQTKSNSKAGYVAVTNNIIGFIAHIVLLILLLLLNYFLYGTNLNLQKPHFGNLALAIIVGTTLILLIIWFKLRKSFAKSLKHIKSTIKLSFSQPARLIGAFFSSMGITMLYALTLFLVAVGLNIDLNFLQIFLVFTISIVALSLVPTPGGIGGVEASLVASFIAFGVDAGIALTATLAYRFITFWLPIIPGAIALEVATKKGYLTKN